jgi:hypothetical protein
VVANPPDDLPGRHCARCARKLAPAMEEDHYCTFNLTLRYSLACLGGSAAVDEPSLHNVLSSMPDVTDSSTLIFCNRNSPKNSSQLTKAVIYYD